MIRWWRRRKRIREQMDRALAAGQSVALLDGRVFVWDDGWVEIL